MRVEHPVEEPESQGQQEPQRPKADPAEGQSEIIYLDSMQTVQNGLLEHIEM